MLLRSAMLSGIALVRTVYCVSPILAMPRRQGQVLRVDRVDHVSRGQASSLKLQRIDIDHDLPVLAAVRGGECDALDRRKLLAQIVEAIVIELLLAETVGAEAELQYRNARGIILHHDRRLDAR